MSRRNTSRGYRMVRLIIVLVLILFISPSTLYPDSGKGRSHGDRSKLLKGCASCHKGHGVYNTPMLSERKEVFCFRCHGNSIYAENAKRAGDIAKDVRTTNVQREFEKPYRHPIEKIGIHRYGEILPEADASMPRHSACGDCHHHHYVTEENKMAGVRGTSKDGVKIRIAYEYELCFNCHSYSANLPAYQTNKAEIFNSSNPSFHPVVAPGKNIDVPSLVPPLTASSLIKCTDCHDNDDPAGPKGPHGSNYRYILSKNYTTTDGSEGPFQYELCYNCHRRSSILSNESFPLHDLHISTAGASCRTCHNPHGSSQYTHLVDFNRASVMSSNSGQFGYMDFGVRAGQCALNCHGKDHDPAVYPGATPEYSPSLSPVPSPSRYPSRYPFGK